MLAGNPKDAKHGAKFHPATSEDGWFVNPDNLTFDPKGRMFVATDGANDFDIPDGIYGVDTEGPVCGLTETAVHRRRGHWAVLHARWHNADGTTLMAQR